MKPNVFFIILITISLFSFSQQISPTTTQNIANLIKKNVTCDWAEQTIINFKS